MQENWYQHLVEFCQRFMQKEAAKLIGVSKVSISAYIRKEARPSSKVVNRILHSPIMKPETWNSYEFKSSKRASKKSAKKVEPSELKIEIKPRITGSVIQIITTSRTKKYRLLMCYSDGSKVRVKDFTNQEAAEREAQERQPENPPRRKNRAAPKTTRHSLYSFN